MADYRKLISAGCGGIPVAEVDDVVGLLLEVSPHSHRCGRGRLHLSFSNSTSNQMSQ